MSVDTKVEKVRGMNASLMNGNSTGGSGGANPLSERDPGRLHITRRQMAFALGLSVLAILATIFTVNSVRAGAQSFPAVVSTSKVYDLNFANNGMVSAVLVKEGDRVKPGQILATQGDASLQTQLAADEATVKADREVLVQAGSPALTAAQIEQDNLQVQQAQTALNNTGAALQSAEASGKANVGAAQAAVTSTQSQETSDSDTYTKACPNGPVTPDPSLTGIQLQAAQSSFTHCQNLQLTLSQDQAAVSKAQAQLPVAQAQAQQAIDTAQANANSAQAALNLANSQQSLQTSPGTASAQAQAQANLNQAESQLAQVQSEVTRRTPGCARRRRRHCGVRSGRGDPRARRGAHLPAARSGAPPPRRPGFRSSPRSPQRRVLRARLNPVPSHSSRSWAVGSRSWRRSRSPRSHRCTSGSPRP